MAIAAALLPIRTGIDVFIASHLALDMRESFLLTSKANLTVLEERTSVRRSNSNIEIRLKSIMKTRIVEGSMTIFTISR